MRGLPSTGIVPEVTFDRLTAAVAPTRVRFMCQVVRKGPEGFSLTTDCLLQFRHTGCVAKKPDPMVSPPEWRRAGRVEPAMSSHGVCGEKA